MYSTVWAGIIPVTTELCSHSFLSTACLLTSQQGSCSREQGACPGCLQKEQHLSQKGATIVRAAKQQLKTLWQMSHDPLWSPESNTGLVLLWASSPSSQGSRKLHHLQHGHCHEPANTGFTLRPENCFLPKKKCFFVFFLKNWN